VEVIEERCPKHIKRGHLSSFWAGWNTEIEAGGKLHPSKISSSCLFK
jgi:hypothetical protein